MKEIAFDGRMTVTKGIVIAVNDGGQAQTVDVKTHDGAVYSGIEVWQAFGVSSVPPADGALAMLFAVGDDPANRMAWLYNPSQRFGGATPGHTILYGADGSRVAIEDGTISVLGIQHVVVKSPDVTVQAPHGVTILGNVTITGTLEVSGDINDHGGAHGSLNDLRLAHDDHHHTTLAIGALTSLPDIVV